MGFARKHGRYKHFYAEWSAYRYGRPKPTISTVRILTGQLRENVIEQVISFLREGRRSLFEFEGQMRAGLRSGFCLGGFRWTISDLEAAEIVHEALRRIGAKRPAWADGQPEATAPNVFCKWCGSELPRESFDGKRRGWFCSDKCGAASFQHMCTLDVRREGEIFRKAYRASQKVKRVKKDCRQCGKEFYPDTKKSLYCSPTCQHRSMIVVELRKCIQCGSEFRPQAVKKVGLFCSRTCRDEHAKLKSFTNKCAYCGEMFEAATERSNYCSERHAERARSVSVQIARSMATGKRYVPRGPDSHLAQRMVDEAFAAAGNLPDVDRTHVIHRLFDAPAELPVSRRHLTAAVFDGWFLNAA